MNLHRSLWLALPIAFLLPLGCNNSGGTGQASEATEASPAVAEPVAAEHGHRHGHHNRGTAGMMFRAAKNLDLTDAQRATVDQLSQQIRGNRGAGRADHQAMHAALVAGVRAGNVDASKFAPQQAAADQARQAHADREAAALNGLWTTLQPAQRQALVASVRERQAEGATRWAGHRHEGKAEGGWRQQRLAHLTAELGLDAAQQQAVDGMLAKGERATPAAKEVRHEEMKARTDALLTAFQGDGFDARKLDLASPEGRMGRGQHRAEFLAQLVPILRADQRETLAASMEKDRE